MDKLNRSGEEGKTSERRIVLFTIYKRRRKEKTIGEIEFSDVQRMMEKHLEEGYQLEFKREVSSTVKRKIPNIIASFANEKGGWLIFGVDEDDHSINLLERKEYELFINNMLKDVTNPIPRIVTRFLSPEDHPGQGVFVI